MLPSLVLRYCITPNIRTKPHWCGLAKQNWRYLHAQWTILLSHEWLIPTNDATLGTPDGFSFNDEPHSDFDTTTVLILHGAGGDKQSCTGLAMELLSSAKKANLKKMQCLLVDTRGCGESLLEDYDPPHNIENATEDVLTLVSVVCPAKYTEQPKVVIGMGALGMAMAKRYMQITTFDQQSSSNVSERNVHSEVSGQGAIIPPVVLFGYPLSTENSLDEKEGVGALHASAVTYLLVQDTGKKEEKDNNALSVQQIRIPEIILLPTLATAPEEQQEPYVYSVAVDTILKHVNELQ